MHMIIAIIVGLIMYALLMSVFQKLMSEEETLSRRLREVERKRGVNYQTHREEILDQPLFERLVRPILEKLGTGIKEITNVFGNSTENDDQLQRLLNQAGTTMKVTEYTALRFTVTIVTAVVAICVVVLSPAMPGTHKILYIAIGLLGPYILMRYMLMAKVTQRKAVIEQQLPDVLDLMSVSVEAGLGFEQAMDYIVSNMEGELIDELAVTSREITMGRTRRDAFILLGERCGAETVKSFTSALVQAIDMGISMKVLLSSQADAMRLHRKRVVEEKAMKLSTKLLFPLIFFIFPSMFIVLLGPAVMNIMNSL